MKKKRLGTIDTGEFWGGEDKKPILHLSIDGIDTQYRGWDDKERKLFYLDEWINATSYPQIYLMVNDDIPDIEFDFYPTWPPENEFIQDMTIINLKNKIHIQYTLYFSETNCVEYSFIERAHKVLNELKKNDFTEVDFIVDYYESEYLIYIEVEKVFINPKETLGELIKPDLKFIESTIEKINKIPTTLKSVWGNPTINEN